MKSFTICYVFFFLLSVAFLIEYSGAAEGDKDGVYIVYMGAAAANGSLKNEHAQLLRSLLRRRKNALVHSYEHGISGFAARLSAAEAQSIAKKPGVVSVFPDPVYQLHTTRSWDFLEYGTDPEIDSNPHYDSNSSSQESDTIIGFLDTGIWPESESFNDKDMGPIPSRWKGACAEAHDFNSSNCNRKFGSEFVLGDNKVIKGEAINFANIGKSPVHPLVYGTKLVRDCFPDSMADDTIKGKIVICENYNDTGSQYVKKSEVQNLGGIGLVLVEDRSRGLANNFQEFPMTVIRSKDAAEPDIAAPGTDILAAWLDNDTAVTLKGKESPKFNIISGTSMSCPHVSGMAAVVKSQYPSWSPSAIKSAIMTTASQISNTGGSITTELGSIATAYDYGAGEISISGPLQPGLVYETTTIDYLNFLCYHGYNTSTIKVISKDVPAGFACPKDSSVDLMSNINYPSIAVFNLTGNQTRAVNRTLTNVAGDGTITYSLTTEAPPSVLKIEVSPTSLQFNKNGQRLSYQVIFKPTVSSLKEDVFGSIIWANKKFKVRTPFVVSKLGAAEGAAEGDKDGVYIVYMGAATADVSSKNHHAQLLSSVLKRRKNAVVHSYEHGISGFAARLSAAEAQSIAKKPGVVSVFPDPVYQLHTTRSWDFLKYGTDVKIDLRPNSDSNSSSPGYDAIIGIIDTGIWPESESFSDKDLGSIPSRWNGSCADAHDFNSSNCNRKIIGARSYGDDGDRLDNTPRDMIGHGTHGEAINFASIGKFPVHPLIYAKSAKNTDVTESEARYAIFT
ncbi:unnamed protein product [Dovyalis caffra]|uniref:Uncharacterized protein n=1 Tax=Dovyalis caffra TaxID=77055 RepID=A0AAV1S5H6_9ROSI|nr:unnamed protein product [Dovyalis caffra]